MPFKNSKFPKGVPKNNEEKQWVREKTAIETSTARQSKQRQKRRTKQSTGMTVWKA